MFPALRTSTQRPVPLEMRPDLTVQRTTYQGDAFWVVKDPVALRYYRLQPEQFCILQLLDGEHSLDDIREEFHRHFPAIRIKSTDIQNLVTDLHRSGLASSNRRGQAAPLLRKARAQRQQRIWLAFQNVLSIRIPGWDPEWLLQRLLPWLAWIFHPAALIAAGLFVLSAWSVLLVHFHEFHSRLPEFHQFFGWPNLLYLWLILGAAKLIHEFGHGLACKYFGGECHEMGFLFLVFSPCLYCDVSDSWLLSNKWKRIAIGAAGMYVELVLSALALYGWWGSSPGLFHYLCLNLFFVTTLTTIIFNANPLLRYDGYYMLADWLETPNLRQKADLLVQQTFGWYCLGIKAAPDPFLPQRKRVLFALFAIASTMYRWVVLAGILYFFYTFLKPYRIQNLGIMLAAFSLVMAVGGPVRAVWKMVTTPRTEPMSRLKISLTLLCSSAAVAALMLIPVPWNLEAPLIIEPHEVQVVYTTIPGILVETYISPGDRVEKGAILAQLEDLALEEEYLDLRIEERVLMEELATHRKAGDLPAEGLVQEKLESIRRRRASFERQRAQLVITAPIAGTVIAGMGAPEPKHIEAEADAKELAPWHGTPLDPRNRGCALDARTQLCCIAPTSKFEAILMIDQKDRNDVAVGNPVRIKLDHLPDETYYGEIAAVSARHQEFAPTSLSSRLGGGLMTVTDGHGRERLTSVVYEASVLVPEQGDLLRMGMRGRARFTVATRTTGQWLWRSLVQTFRFGL